MILITSRRGAWNAEACITVSPAIKGQAATMNAVHEIRTEPSPKRVRLMANGKTVVDSLGASLLLETGAMPVYYFPRGDVRMDLMERSNYRTQCRHKGEASWWTLTVAGRPFENVAWSHEQPREPAMGIAGQIAFAWDRMDHRFEEDEEVLGHPRDPHHRIDVRASSREIRAFVDDEMVARTRRALFLFETGLPTRYYIPAEDVRSEFLVASRKTSVCPYKGTASYWSLRVGDRVIEDAVWAYLDPLPECPRIRGYFCFYPEKLSRLDVEGEPPKPAAK